MYNNYNNGGGGSGGGGDHNNLFNATNNNKPTSPKDHYGPANLNNHNKLQGFFLTF